MITTTIVFDHRGRAKSRSDMGPVEVRVTVNRKPYYINTGVRVKKSQFHDGVVSLPKGSVQANKEIEIIVGRIREEVMACVENELPIDVAEIKRKVWACDDKGPTFLEWVTAEVENLGLRYGTMRHYRSLVNRLAEFNEIRRWQDVTVDNIYKFDRFLHTLKRKQTATEIDAKRPKVPLHANTIHNYHKDLKALLFRALKIGKIDYNPYEKLRGEFKRVDNDSIEYLTRDEVERFESVQTDIGSTMEAARDLFVFQLYTGMAYADTQTFDIGNYKDVGGKWVNVGERVKTGVAYISMLLPPAVEVLKRYNMRTPKMTVQVYNRNLKILGERAKISRPLHSHMARHTFATWMLSEGVKIENVSQMLGHTNVRQTQRYAKVLAQDVYNDFDKISKKLKKEKK